MIHQDGRIRFFFQVESKHREFLESQLYAHYSDIEIRESDFPIDTAGEFQMQEARLAHIDSETLKLYVSMKDRTEKESIDPISSLTSALSKCRRGDTAFIRVDFAPLPDHSWREGSQKKIIEIHLLPTFAKVVLLQHWSWIRVLLFPFVLIVRFFALLVPQSGEGDDHGKKDDHPKEGKAETKFDNYGYATRILVGASGESSTRDIASSLSIFSHPKGGHLTLSRAKRKIYDKIPKTFSKYKTLLSATELAGIIHLPTIYVKTPGVNWVTTRKFEPPHNLPVVKEPNTPIGVSNFRGSTQGFGIQPIDRARHVYIIGKTGMGKSTLLENMLYSDIMSGRGVGLIDPHGDLADTILANIPKSRTNDIVLFDPSDTEFPIAFNMLDNPRPELRPIVASGLVSIFKKMFAESWGPRLEYILRNTILTLLLIPDTTLISIPLMLTHESYRRKVVSKITDPILIQFWTQEFEKMAPAQMSEAINPILNKV
jgi:Helicase HerA, central domain